MSVFDKVVRPVEIGTTPRRVPSEQARSVEKVVLRAGRTGSGRTFSGSASTAMTFYCEAHDNEVRTPLRKQTGINATPRKTHVRRFWQEEEDGSNRDEDVWIDVQRIDELEVTAEPGAQKVTYHTRWYEDDEGTDNSTRKLRPVKVVNPDDETQFVRIPSIETADWIARPYISRPNVLKPVIVGGEDGVGKPFGFFQGQFTGYQDEKSHFKHEVDDEGVSTGDSPREGKVRVVEHRDVEMEPNDNGFFPDNDYDLPAGDENVDDSQKVYFEFPTRVQLNTGVGVNEQQTYTNLRQEYLFDIFTETPAPQDLEAGGTTRLDPFQNIVNVSWNRRQPTVLAVSKYTGSATWNHLGEFFDYGPTDILRVYEPDGTLRFAINGHYWLASEVALGPNDMTAVVGKYPPHEAYGNGDLFIEVYDRNGAPLWNVVRPFEIGGWGHPCFDSDGNLIIVERSFPSTNTLVKFGLSGERLFEVPVTATVTAGNLSIDPWGNTVLIEHGGFLPDGKVSMYSPQGVQKWSIPVDTPYLPICDRKGNTWVIVGVLGDNVNVLKFNHFGIQIAAIEGLGPGGFGIDIDIDERNHLWARTNLSTDDVHEYDEDGNLLSTVTFPASPQFPGVDFIVFTAKTVSAATNDVALCGSFYNTLQEEGSVDLMSFVYRNKRTGENKWSVVEQQHIPDFPFESPTAQTVHWIYAVAKRFIGSKKSPESEPA